MFQRTIIAGLGLMGSSLALAMRAAGLSERIYGVEQNREYAEKVLKRQIVDKVVEGTLPEADLLVLATPLEGFAEVLQKLPKNMPAHMLILDIASVKEPAIDVVLQHLPESLRSRYVPCHPITGAAGLGPDAADAALYKDHNLLITPQRDCAEEALDRAKSFWRRLGMTTQIMTPGKHDRVYAYVSHLPQLLAYTFLLAFPGELKPKGLERFLRIGGSNPALWQSIFLANRAHLLLVLEQLQMEMRHFPQFSAYGQMQAALAAMISEEYRPYAGPGFRDFSSDLAPDVAKALPQSPLQLHHEIAIFHQLLHAGDKDRLLNYLRRAKALHNQCFG